MEKSNKSVEKEIGWKIIQIWIDILQKIEYHRL